MDADLLLPLLWLGGFLHGAAIAYIIWAPSTPFKQGFLSGITFGLIGKKKR